MKRISLLLCLLLIPALACSTASIAESLVSSGGVLYQDYFSDTQSGWGEVENDTGAAGYVDGAYHIIVNQPRMFLWSHPGMNFTNIRQEVSLMPVAGPESNQMGLICRLQDENNYYFFVVSADGFYGIGKMKDGTTSLLTGLEMQQHPSIKTGYQINQVRADCIGNLLILYVNNTLVTSAMDNDFVTGDVGILAGTFDNSGVDVYFDNLVVTKP